MTTSVAMPPAMGAFLLCVKTSPSSAFVPAAVRLILRPGGLLHGRTVMLYEMGTRNTVLHRTVSQSSSPFVVQFAATVALAMSSNTSQVSSLLSQFTARRE